MKPAPTCRGPAKNRWTGTPPGVASVPWRRQPPDAPRVTLFLSDLHLGRGTPAATRAAERDAMALLRAHESDLLGPDGTLVLLGDVFDQFIEYRHLVPKSGARLVGLLADWADRGARILYVVGNRDLWHVDYFEREIGLTVLRDGATVRLDGHRTYIAHGDRETPGTGLAGRLSLRFQPLLRAPAMARLYRTSLPGDAGFALARWVAYRFGSDGAPEPDATAALAQAAQERLRTTDAEVVAHGHVHEAVCTLGRDGAYLNPGYWFGDRTFGRLTPDGPTLFRWVNGRALPL